MMVQADPLDQFDADLAVLVTRLAELRESSPSDAERLMLPELESAVERLREVSTGLTAKGDEIVRRQVAGDRERSLLKSVFRDLPLAVLLLDRDGRVRRANNRAHGLLDVSADYVSGQPFVVFLTAADRNLFRMRLSVLHRSGADQSLAVTLARRGQPVPARLTLTCVDQPGDPRPVVAVIAVPTAGQPSAAGQGALEMTRAEALLTAVAPDPTPSVGTPADPPSDEIRAAARGGDIIREVTRILLEERNTTDAVVLQRVGTRLANRFAGWVVVDMLRGDAAVPTRAVVVPPAAERESGLAKSMERADAGAAPLPARVMTTGASVLHPHLDDLSVLGVDERGVAFLGAMGAHSLLCIPVRRSGRVVGTVTLARTGSSEPFRLTDQAAAEEVADLLGYAVLRQPESTDPAAHQLAEPFLPQRILSAPELDVAWLHLPGRGGASPFLDFYDLPGGWGATLGSVPVGGAAARAHVAMVRQWALLLGSDNVVPSGVLDELDDGLRRLRLTDLAVSAAVLALERRPRQLGVAMASAGHRSSLCVRVDGRVQRTDGGGLALNSPGGYDTHADTDELNPGDALVLYSNELAEVADAAGETFAGSGELTNCLARVAGQTARRMVDTLAAGLTEFAPAGGPADAVVAVVIRYVGDPD